MNNDLYTKLTALGAVLRREVGQKVLSVDFVKSWDEAYTLLKEYEHRERYKIIGMLCAGEDVGGVL